MDDKSQFRHIKSQPVKDEGRTAPDVCYPKAHDAPKISEKAEQALMKDKSPGWGARK